MLASLGPAAHSGRRRVLRVPSASRTIDLRALTWDRRWRRRCCCDCRRWRHRRPCDVMSGDIPRLISANRQYDQSFASSSRGGGSSSSSSFARRKHARQMAAAPFRCTATPNPASMQSSATIDRSTDRPAASDIANVGRAPSIGQTLRLACCMSLRVGSGTRGTTLQRRGAEKSQQSKIKEGGFGIRRKAAAAADAGRGNKPIGKYATLSLAFLHD
jgi:hypothetical protein